jgi:hypothetical protein
MQELDNLVESHVLTFTQAQVLRRGIMPTTIPTSTELDQLIIVDQGPAVKDGYIIKSIRKGRSEGIMFGEDLPTAEWSSLIPTMTETRRTCRTHEYIVQTLIRQPVLDLQEIFGKPCRGNVVGSCHLEHRAFTGLGVWRANSGRMSNLAEGGIRLLSIADSGS